MASNTHFTPSIVGSFRNLLIGTSITTPSQHFTRGDVLYVVRKEQAQIDNNLA